MVREIQSAIAVAAFALSLSGCANAPLEASAQPPKEPPGTPITLTAQQVKEIQAGVRAFLKDPDSAKFSGPVLAAKRPNGDIEACGMVNAKNSYGGYAGDSPYVATLRNGKVIDGTTASGNDAQFVIQICRERGVPL
jgi:hypothetical protein